MVDLVKVESKRIFNKYIALAVLLITILLLVYMVKSFLQGYDVLSYTGIEKTWKENLKESKKESKGFELDEKTLLSLQDLDTEDIKLYENIDEVLEANLGSSDYFEIDKEKAKGFYEIRKEKIKEILEESPNIKYSEKEKENFLKKADDLKTPISMEYAEGWKNLNGRMRLFIPLLLIVASIIALQVFGEFDKFSMREICITTVNGRKKFNKAKILSALKIGLIIYLTGVIILLLSHGIIYGLDGWNVQIQSSSEYFLSSYNINYLQQFLLNGFIGIVALLFMIGFVLFVTGIFKQVMIGGVGAAFLWVTMIIIEQVPIFKINHFFANFLPYKMTDFQSHYNSYEIYRVFGISFNAITWITILVFLISLILIISSYFIYGKEKK